MGASLLEQSIGLQQGSIWFSYRRAWIERFGTPRQLKGSRIDFDQWPIFLSLGSLNWGPSLFQFENMWLDHPSFKANISTWWNAPTYGRWVSFQFMEKLRALKGQLKRWNKEVFGDIRIKKEIVARIDEIDALDLEGFVDNVLKEERFSLKGNLVELIRKEKVSWIQKSKIKWDKEGDNNTSFFHRKVSGKRNKNQIGLLCLDNGESSRDGKVIK